MCLFLAYLMIGCKENTPTPSASAPSTPTTSAPATSSPAASAPTTSAPAPTAKPETPAPEPKAEEAISSGTERIKLDKGASDTDLDINLDARETKKYVAFVAKGFMTCIMPNTDLGSKVTVKVNGVTRNLAEDGPCGEHAKTAGDQTIEFINNGNKEIPFVANVSFNEHM